jgi:hypothetical protein
MQKSSITAENSVTKVLKIRHQVLAAAADAENRAIFKGIVCHGGSR